MNFASKMTYQNDFVIAKNAEDGIVMQQTKLTSSGRIIHVRLVLSVLILLGLLATVVVLCVSVYGNPKLSKSLKDQEDQQVIHIL
jgi:hypothetical protein